MKNRTTLATRILLFALCAAMLMSMLAACGGDGSGDAQTTDPAATVDPAVTTAPSVEDDPFAGLPDKKYEGYVFTFLNVDPATGFWMNNTLNVEEASGVKVDQAIYTRNRIVEDQFDVVIEEVVQKDPIGFAQTALSAQEDSYDVILDFIRDVPAMVNKNYAIDWNDLPYVDLTSDAWCQDMIKDLSIGGKLYTTSGDLSMTSYDSTSVFGFNKQMAEEQQLGDLYQLVRDGQWTFDKLYEFSTKVAQDVDNDGKYKADDIYGIFTYNGIFAEMLTAAGVRLVTKDAEDMPVFTAKGNESFYNIYEKVLEVLHPDGVYISCDDYTQFKGNTLKFVGGGSLFYSDVVFWISTMSEMEADYGILPNPKYNAEQENYLASINAVATSMVIPYTASDLERTSVILQALAQHSNQNMIETYYDEIVTVRNVRDPESREMINLAFENRVIDLCTVYDWGAFASTMKVYMVQNKNNIASLVGRLESKVTAKMEEYIESCNLDV